MDDAGVIARRVVVHGHVQGVFFRATVARAAGRHGVAGWATNCADGSVEVFLEGEPDAVESVIEVCRTGPRGADVESVDIADAEPEDSSGFETR
jgi:acylphosphatase